MDEGRYVCIARNSAGEERTESVLTVVVPLQARLVPQEQRVEIGHEAVFNCSVQGKFHMFWLEWMASVPSFQCVIIVDLSSDLFIIITVWWTINYIHAWSCVI